MGWQIGRASLVKGERNRLPRKMPKSSLSVLSICAKDFFGMAKKDVKKWE